jgi:hypothetical protein
LDTEPFVFFSHAKVGQFIEILRANIWWPAHPHTHERTCARIAAAGCHSTRLCVPTTKTNMTPTSSLRVVVSSSWSTRNATRIIGFARSSAASILHPSRPAIPRGEATVSSLPPHRCYLSSGGAGCAAAFHRTRVCCCSDKQKAAEALSTSTTATTTKAHFTIRTAADRGDGTDERASSDAAEARSNGKDNGGNASNDDNDVERLRTLMGESLQPAAGPLWNAHDYDNRNGDRQFIPQVALHPHDGRRKKRILVLCTGTYVRTYIRKVVRHDPVARIVGAACVGVCAIFVALYFCLLACFVFFLLGVAACCLPSRICLWRIPENRL